jgi:hypothetical protein
MNHQRNHHLGFHHVSHNHGPDWLPFNENSDCNSVKSYGACGYTHQSVNDHRWHADALKIYFVATLAQLFMSVENNAYPVGYSLYSTKFNIFAKNKNVLYVSDEPVSWPYCPRAVQFWSFAPDWDRDCIVEEE